ncbi:MAG: hypothetical protein RI900_2467 [Actinomycetota bacterium]|jgi:uncharacterized membrane protein YdbT with pleckstrin-like domain
MPYPKRNLNADETIALDMHPHWWYFAEPAFTVLGVVIIAVFVKVRFNSGNALDKFLGLAAIAALVVSAAWLVSRYLKWISTNFVITSQRLIFRQGIIAKHGIEIPLERVNNVNFSQGILERMLGAGDLLIESGGEDGQQRFTDIRHPDQVQNLIHSQMESVARRRAGYSGPAAAAGPSVAEQLERLEGLLHRGTISQSEFDAEKRRLLG